MAGGTLRLEAKDVRTTNRHVSNARNSAVVTTQTLWDGVNWPPPNKWTCSAPCTVEVRAKFPAGDGAWLAVFLINPDDWSQEIDIVEQLGKEDHSVHFYVHKSGKAEGTKYTATNYEPTAWHTYRVDWTSSRVIWYLDGVEVLRSSMVPNGPMILAIELVPGDESPQNWAGPSSPASFPMVAEIDWIAVW